jgi:hypothetical protein
MPCNSNYLNATHREHELSRVACLLDELAGRKIETSWWNGYHPRVYCLPDSGDKLVQELCAALQGVDVSCYSLEMQIWHRDHLKADQQRIKEEQAAALRKLHQESGLSKLTNAEKAALGLI